MINDILSFQGANVKLKTYTPAMTKAERKEASHLNYLDRMELKKYPKRKAQVVPVGLFPNVSHARLAGSRPPDVCDPDEPLGWR